MDIKTFAKKNGFILAVGSLAALTLLLLVFRAGVSLGSRKALFACQWSENYHRNFGGPPPGGLMFDIDPGMPSHGIFGRVIGSATDTLLIKQNDGLETSVVVTDDTVIEMQRQRVPISEVHLYETVVVIGEPNAKGQVVASFVRILPAPPDASRNDSDMKYFNIPPR